MVKTKSKRYMGLLLCLTFGLTISACGSGKDTASNQPATSGGSSSAKLEVIKIATQSPLSGSQSSFGEALKLGAEMALKEKSEEFKKLGFDLQLSPQDDQADPKQGVANAELIISDKNVLGVVGHANSGVAIPSSVKYEQGQIAMVAPANTAVEITERGLKTVNRISSRDDIQGKMGAKYSYEQLGAKSAFVIHDKSSYGQGLADMYAKGFSDLGGTVIGKEGIGQGEKDFSSVINLIISKKPDIVFFGGMYPEGALILKQAKDKGYEGKFMSGDGFDSSEAVKLAGNAIVGSYFTTIVADVNQTDEGKKWAAAYKTAYGKDPESYALYGYDSMGVMLDGVLRAIKENGGAKPKREQVVAAVRATKDYKGKFTNVTFDAKGDNIQSGIYIYKFEQASYPAKFLGQAK